MRAAASRALWGSPLPGLRVSFDAAGSRDAGWRGAGALGIAPTGIARILRRRGLPRCGRSGDRPYRDCAYPSTPRADAVRAQKIAPLLLRRILSSLFSVLCSLFSVLLPLAFYLLPLTSYLLPFTFYLLPFTSYLLPFRCKLVGEVDGDAHLEPARVEGIVRQ
jgi:hypothetical protein